jgi:site-specific recombinase XerC
MKKFSEQFLAEVSSGKSTTSRRNYHYRLARFIQFCATLHIHTPAQLTPTAIRKYQQTIDTLSVVSRYAYLETTKKFLAFMQTQSAISFTPIIPLPKMPYNPAIKRYIPQEMIIQRIQSIENPRDKAILMLFFLEKCSIESIAALTIEDLDLSVPELRLIAKQRLLPLKKETVPLLTAWLTLRPTHSSSASLFLTASGRPLSCRGIQKLLQRARAADLPPHSQRKAR